METRARSAEAARLADARVHHQQQATQRLRAAMADEDEAEARARQRHLQGFRAGDPDPAAAAAAAAAANPGAAQTPAWMRALGKRPRPQAVMDDATATAAAALDAETVRRRRAAGGGLAVDAFAEQWWAASMAGLDVGSSGSGVAAMVQ